MGVGGCRIGNEKNSTEEMPLSLNASQDPGTRPGGHNDESDAVPSSPSRVGHGDNSKQNIK